MQVQRKNKYPNLILGILVCRLGVDGTQLAGPMCEAVTTGDVLLLQRFLLAGAPADVCDYDRRCALHIAAAEGNLSAVRELVERGGADPAFQDRWVWSDPWVTAGPFLPIRRCAMCRGALCRLRLGLHCLSVYALKVRCRQSPGCLLCLTAGPLFLYTCHQHKSLNSTHLLACFRHHSRP